MLGPTSPLQATDRPPTGPHARGRPTSFARGPGALVTGGFWLLAAVLIGAALWQSLAVQRSSPPPAARSALVSQGARAALPLAAQGPISRALGAEIPSYRVSASGGILQARNRAQRLNARFSAAGVQLNWGTAEVGLSLRAVGYGNSLHTTGDVTPSTQANRVGYARASLSEWYVNGPLGLEQGFTIPRSPPAKPAGPLTLSMALSGNARASLIAGGHALTLSHAGAPSLNYGGLTATDASGRTLHSWLAMRSGRVLLRVDTADARYPLTIDPLIQQGVKITGVGEQGEARFGVSVAVSADGNTALIGGPGDNESAGAVWVFTRSGSGWIQQGAKLTGSEEVSEGGEEQCTEEAGEEPWGCSFGRSVALSADGNTALVGDPSSTARHGSVWVFTRSGSSWTQQGAPLTGGNERGEGRFGKSVALSADGNTALVGDPSAADQHGTAWEFTRSGSIWTAQSQVLPTAEQHERVHYGRSVALSSDGNTALIGNPGASGYIGSAWVLTRQGSVWTQQGNELTGGEATGDSHFGRSVALSGDGQTALIGGQDDAEGLGAAWIFTNSGSTFSQQGKKLTNGRTHGHPLFGYSLALSADGGTALIGAPGENANFGAARAFKRVGGEWIEQEEQLAGSEQVGSGQSGGSVALSADAKVALITAAADNDWAGAAWGFVDQPLPTMPPAVTAVEPISGPARGGTAVVIRGSSFSAAQAVSFGSSPAARFEQISATTIVAVSPSEPAGTVDVTVTTPTGTSATSARARFTFEAPPKARQPNNPVAPGVGATVGTPPASATGQSAGGVLGFTGSSSAKCAVTLSRKRIVVQRYRVALLRLLRSGTGPCKGAVTLKYKLKHGGRHFKLKTIGTAGFSISPGRSQVVRVTLNKAGRALLRARHGKLNASLAIVRATPAPRLGRTASVHLSVKKPPRSTAVKS